MRSIRLSAGVVVSLAALISSACASRSRPSEQTEPAAARATEPGGMAGMQHAASAWKEMDDFHMVMMATWHPVKQSNDLGPIRAKAASLSDKARTWATSKVPTACDTKETRDALAKVAEESRALADLVARNASDDQVKAALAGVHDRFEPVEHGCKPGHHG